MTSQAARFVGSIPEHYDVSLGPHLFNGYAADLAERVALLHPDSVLELAAGTGILTRRLRDRLGSECELIASDLNPPMLKVAKAKFRPGERVRFERVDAMEIGFKDHSFDTVVCQFGVMFFPDKMRSFAEVLRVLKPGGSYVFNVWDSWDSNPFAKITHEAVARFFAEDPPGFYKVPFSYHDVAQIKESVLAAGFARVTIEPLALHSPIPSSDQFAMGLVYGNPLYDEILHRGGDPETVRSAVSREIEQKLGSQMPLRALVVQAAVT